MFAHKDYYNISCTIKNGNMYNNQSTPILSFVGISKQDLTCL